MNDGEQYWEHGYRHGAFTRAVAEPRLVPVLPEPIGANFRLRHTMMLVKPSERGASCSRHQDYPYFPHERHTVLAASMQLDDADGENGCLCTVPGTHRPGPLAAYGPSSTVDAAKYPLGRGAPRPARVKDALVSTYLAVHGSGPNRGSRTRRNVRCQYRDRADSPVLRDGVEEDVDWGQGPIVAGPKPSYRERRPRFEVKAA
jgi:phytanoyl-CoA hydroxylase